MRELRDILDARRRLRAAGGRAVLATIVDCSGSTYRRPGARMLIPEAGEPVGLLSGGCLEGDLAERAAAVLGAGRPRTVLYDMTSQEDLVWGLGLGCAGKVHVLLEPLPGTADDYLDFLARILEGEAPGAAATLFARERGERGIGSRILLEADGSTRGSLGEAALDRTVPDALREARRTGTARVMSCGEDDPARVLVEGVQPPVPLVLFGAGPDVPPVVRLARELGWRVTVVDHRPRFARPERFPEADRVVACAADDVPAQVRLDARTVALVMTHKFLHDVELAAVLVPSPVRYLGFLGPRARTERILAELRERGVVPTDGQLARVHGPVGLDIGAETPHEIAVSALAEIQTVLAGRSGTFLRDRRGPLHQRPR